MMDAFCTAWFSFDPMVKEAAEVLSKQPELEKLARLHFDALKSKFRGEAHGTLFMLAVGKAEKGEPAFCAPPPQPGSIRMQSKFSGFCRTCQTVFDAGELIDWRKVGGESFAAHAKCGLK